MIEKIPGRPQIDKLRVIHLLADLNLILGIIWESTPHDGRETGPLETNSGVPVMDGVRTQ
jgi:hypothetical protein